MVVILQPQQTLSVLVCQQTWFSKKRLILKLSTRQLLIDGLQTQHEHPVTKPTATQQDQNWSSWPPGGASCLEGDVILPNRIKHSFTDKLLTYSHRATPSTRDLKGSGVLVTVVTGPLPSTSGPRYRRALAAVPTAECRTHNLDSHWSAVRQLAAAGWSPILLAPRTRWLLWQQRKAVSPKYHQNRSRSTKKWDEHLMLIFKLYLFLYFFHMLISCLQSNVIPSILGGVCRGDDWKRANTQISSDIKTDLLLAEGLVKPQTDTLKLVWSLWLRTKVERFYCWLNIANYKTPPWLSKWYTNILLTINTTWPTYCRVNTWECTAHRDTFITPDATLTSCLQF